VDIEKEELLRAAKLKWKWIALGAIVMLAAIYVFLWLPEWMVHQTFHGPSTTPKDDAELVDSYRKTIVQAIGGLLVFGTLAVGLQQLKISRETQITDRFTKAIGYLGAVSSQGEKQIETRLGGIYALERIAKDSPDDHWPIMEILTAYVRHNAPWRGTGPVAEPEKDIQAAMTVIGRRVFVRDRHRHINLSRVNLSGIDLPRAHLDGAIIQQAHLSLWCKRLCGLLRLVSFSGLLTRRSRNQTGSESKSWGLCESASKPP
jgi:hypothetical protein